MPQQHRERRHANPSSPYHNVENRNVSASTTSTPSTIPSLIRPESPPRQLHELNFERHSSRPSSEEIINLNQKLDTITNMMNESFNVQRNLQAEFFKQRNDLNNLNREITSNVCKVIEQRLSSLFFEMADSLNRPESDVIPALVRDHYNRGTPIPSWHLRSHTGEAHSSSPTPFTQPLQTQSSPPPQTQTQTQLQSQLPQQQQHALSPSAISDTFGAIEDYKLSRKLVSVTQLWKEWTVGLEENLPSVLDLNRKFGAKWRTKESERQFYSMRLTIIKAILKTSKDQNIPLEEAVNLLEERRGNNTWSLSKLSKVLREEQNQQGNMAEAGSTVGS